MVYRHLEIERTEELIVEIEKFVKVKFLLVLMTTHCINMNRM